MSDKYTITVENKSSNPQTYAIFNKQPQVSGRVQEKVWSNVFATKNVPVNQSVTFEIINQYHAIVGQKQQNDDKTFSVTVAGTTPVQLGVQNADGTTSPGTTLSMIVADESPQFEADPLPNSSLAAAFEIRTGSFSNSDAKEFGYMIGLGPAKSGGAIAGPAATFIPEANSTYQIQPVNTYYITAGSYTKGDLIDVTKVATKYATADFTKKRNYKIVHGDNGALTIQV